MARPTRSRWYFLTARTGIAFLVITIFVIATNNTEVSGFRPKPRPCDPHRADYPPDSGTPKWRPGSYAGCLGGTADAPGSGNCERVWCANGVLKIDPDPIESHEGESTRLRVYIQGGFETGGNVRPYPGTAEIDWGDGSHDSLPVDQNLDQTREHVYAKAGVYYPSAHIAQDFKYHGNGSCSYRCDLRRAAIAVVYPALKAPYLHKVSSGDSLSSIAVRYGVSDWDDIYEANRVAVKWPELIYPDQVLLVAENVSKNSGTFSSKVAEAWGRLRGLEPLSDEHPAQLKSHEALQGFGEWIIDQQVELQIEGGRKDIESQVEEKLNNGSAGVVVRIAIYSQGNTKVPQVEVWGEGETPLIGVGNGLGPSLSAGTPGLFYDADHSYFSFYTLNNGKVTHRDMPEGWLTSGDAATIQAQAEKQKESLRIGREIAKQMSAAKAKADQEKSLQGTAADAQASAPVRQTIDMGPLSANRGDAPRKQGGHEPPSHPETNHEPGGLPKGDAKGNSQGPSSGGGQRSGSGLPPQRDIPIGGEHPGQPGHSDNDKGIPIGNPPKPSDHPYPERDPSTKDKPQSLLIPDGFGTSFQLVEVRFASNAELGFHESSTDPRFSERTETGDNPKTTSGNSVSSYVSSNDATFWGFPNSRTWIDVNGDGIPDFCRVVKAGPKDFAIRCTLAKGRNAEQRYAGVSFETIITGFQPTGRFDWVDINGDGRPAFCRVITKAKRLGVLSCFPVNGTSFGPEIRTTKPIDMGIPSGRAWIDFDGDGKMDFCTLLEKRPGVGTLSCLLSTGNGFADTPILSKQTKWKASAYRRWLTTLDGTAEFCTVAGPGNKYVDCTVSVKTGFGETYRDLLYHSTQP